MRAANEALKSWKQLSSIETLSDLRDAVRSAASRGQDATNLRSICWKAFLLFENMNRASWLDILAESRKTYTSLRDHYVRPIEHPEEYDTNVDPLSETDESPWVALRKDEALRTEIFQDVERCMPENVYFRQPATQKMLLDVLFIYCKLNADVGYRQGMHEILAPVLWVVESDAIDLKKAEGQEDKILFRVLDSRYVEHDTFTIFGLIMQNAKSFYAPAPENSSTDTNNATESPMIERSKRIYNSYLPKVDPGLFGHLVKLEIVPQIFLMRWVRLLFGREFPFNDVLGVWDLLFAEDPSLELVDLISVAMLLRIRWQLVEADTNTAFTLLLRYTTPDSARSFVEDALVLRRTLNVETGSEIIEKHSGRVPPLINRVDQARPKSPLARRPLSPGGSPGQRSVTPRSFEAIIQDAAKGIYSRSEKLGLNKAVRDAVGDFRKNLQQLNTAPPTRTGSREYRRTKPGLNQSDRAGSSELLRRITALESRNKQLAKMLERTVGELWEYQATRAEKATDGEKESLEALSTAVAKVQFVQVYLEDTTIPLPTEEIEPKPSSPPPSDSKALRTKTSASASRSTNAIDKKSEGEDDGAVPKLPTRPSTATVPNIPTIPDPVPTDTLTPTLSPNRSRPSLAESSFSWMLGDEEPPTKAFILSTSPHNAFPVEQRRKAASGGKGYLFGDDDEENGRGKEEHRGKKKASRPRAPSDIDEEVIDLGPLGGTKGSVA